MMLTKSMLAIQLSKLEVFDNPDVQSEQYPTDSESAALTLWNAYMLGDIEDKVVADLGCGTGILGIAALLLGARKVYFVDKDGQALTIAKKNVRSLKGSSAEFVQATVRAFDTPVDTVIQNPPFGTKTKAADRPFIEQALKIGHVTYSFHLSSTQDFIEKFTRDLGKNITHRWPIILQIKGTQKFHRKKIHDIRVDVIRIA